MSVVDLTVSDDETRADNVNIYNASQNDSIAATLDGDSDIEEVVFENLSDDEIARRISAANQLRIQRLRRREQQRRNDVPDADRGDARPPWRRNPHALPNPSRVDREVIEISSGDEDEPELVEDDVHRARRRLQRAARQAQDAMEQPRRRRGESLARLYLVYARVWADLTPQAWSLIPT